MIKVLVLLLILSTGIGCVDSQNTTQDPKKSEGKILSETYLVYNDFPSEIVTPRNIEVWLPEKYAQLESLPVLYMFDGGAIFHRRGGGFGNRNQGWEVDSVLDSLNQEGTVPEVIVVGIFNMGRQRIYEYMPAKPEALLQQRMNESDDDRYKNKQSESDEQLKFIVEELKPFIDANFKTKSDRENTFISGSSMGGMISAYAICEYPEVFGGAACISTHWPLFDGYFVEYVKNNLPDPETHKIYFDYGTKGIDGTYEPFQVRVDSAMMARGYEENINWLTRKFEGANHNGASWHKRFHIPMKFLLSED